MYITKLCINGEEVATARTLMPLAGGPGQWVQTPAGAFWVFEVHSVETYDYPRNDHAVAEVGLKDAGTLPPLHLKEIPHSEKRARLIEQQKKWDRVWTQGYHPDWNHP